MRKSAIYTKTGDKGETSLVSGKRISKGDNRIHLYGEVDELNSFIGVLTTYLENKDLTQRIQSDLFNLGSNLATEAENRKKFNLPQIKRESIRDLEIKIDEMDALLAPLKNFVLPGGTIAAAEAHICRTITRRVERSMVFFMNETGEELPENSLEYINRLSDYFFVLARFLNFKANCEEIQWIPENK